MTIFADLRLNDALAYLAAVEPAVIEDSGRKQRERQFIDVVSRYDRIISKVCYTYAISKEDFDDLRQDVVINIWRGLDSFRGDSAPQTWIYRVALNTCISTMRKNRGRGESVSVELLGDRPDDSSSVEMERIEELHSMIARLNPEEKAIILMRLEDFKYEEIAEVMGMHRNTIATRIHRIKDKLVEMAKNDC